MIQHWTFRQKIAIGFALTVVLTVAIGGVAIWGLQRVVSSKDQVITVNSQILIDAEKMRASLERKGSGARAFLLASDERYLLQLNDARTEFLTLIDRLKH